MRTLLAALLVTVAAALVGPAFVGPALPTAEAALPIPPGPLDLTVPRFEGAAVADRPIASFSLPEHPFMAAAGRNTMHNDAYATDAYAQGGPLGRDLQVTSATYGVVECATLTFTRAGDLVGLCGGLDGFQLMRIDPDTLDATARMRTSTRDLTSGANPLTDLCGGAYFYLDHRDRAVVETADGEVWIARLTADGFERVRTYDARPALPEGDCLIALNPDWSGRIWFVTRLGGVGTIDPATGAVRSLRLAGEEIVNSFAVDETGGVFIVSDHALYRFDATTAGAPRVTWRQPYDRGTRLKPGQLSQGSGTTPTLIGRDLVVITDNAEPRMNVVAYRRGSGSPATREVCRVPVFAEGTSATENSLVAVGRSVIVENNYGYESPATTTLGRSTAPGITRVDVSATGCRTLWTSTEIAPTSVPKVSLTSGLLYVYGKPAGNPADPWYFTAIDVRSGTTVWRRLTGTGPAWNNHYAAIYLGPDRTAYVATLVGLVRVADRR